MRPLSAHPRRQASVPDSTCCRVVAGAIPCARAPCLPDCTDKTSASPKQICGVKGTGKDRCREGPVSGPSDDISAAISAWRLNEAQPSVRHWA
jgi:hypothetical protein